MLEHVGESPAELLSAEPLFTLRSIEKAAVLFLCLQQERGADLMGDLDEEEIHLLTRAMSTLGTIPAYKVEEVIREFCQEVSGGGGVVGSVETVRRMLSGILDEGKVSEILDGLSGGRSNKSVWEGVSSLNEKVIANYLEGERDQVIAVVLSRVKPDVTARVLPLFEMRRRADISRKMIFMEAIPHAVLEEIETAIASELLGPATRSRASDAHQRMADVFNKMDPSIFEELAGNLTETAPEAFASIKQKMFTFDDLSRLDGASLQRIIRVCEGNTLPLALRGAQKHVRDAFLAAMTERARGMMQDEMDMMEQVKSRDAREAQARIIDLVNDLVRQDVIRLPSEDDEML